MEFHGIDSPLDVGRALVFLLSLWCCVTLLRRYKVNNEAWTTKTIDYWFALFAWSVAGVILMAQGILLNRPLTPATIFVIVAVLVTGKGLHAKGAWGGTDT